MGFYLLAVAENQLTRLPSFMPFQAIMKDE